MVWRKVRSARRLRAPLTACRRDKSLVAEFAQFGDRIFGHGIPEVRPIPSLSVARRGRSVHEHSRDSWWLAQVSFRSCASALVVRSSNRSARRDNTTEKRPVPPSRSADRRSRRGCDSAIHLDPLRDRQAVGRPPTGAWAEENRPAGGSDRPLGTGGGVRRPVWRNPRGTGGRWTLASAPQRGMPIAGMAPPGGDLA